MKLLRCSLLLLVIAIVIFGGATALAAESWAADPVTGTRVGIVHDVYTIVAASWSGSAVDGKADGSGKLTMTVKGKDGKTYTFTGDAEMKAGIINGRVAIKWSTGDSFDGTYRDSKMEKGIHRNAKGDVYEGDFKNNYYDGYGIYKFPDGGIYEGEWKKGVYEGKGIRKWPDGRVYEGDFKNNYYDGYGIYKFPDGGVYEGEWKKGVYEGKGIFKWPDGRVYEGDFKNNVPHGYGIRKDASGKVVHDGEWKDGKPVTPLKADNVLGVPWGATEEQAKDVLLKRPNTIRVSYLDGKNGEHKWLYFGGSFADFPDAWIYVHFYQGKMWQFRISWPLKDDQVMNRYEALKQGLTGRYGPPSVERGKYLDSRTWWALGQNYHVGIEIGQNTFNFKIAPADPMPTTHPFRVYITYYNKDVVDILQSSTPGGSKDY